MHRHLLKEIMIRRKKHFEKAWVKKNGLKKCSQKKELQRSLILERAIPHLYRYVSHLFWTEGKDPKSTQVQVLLDKKLVSWTGFLEIAYERCYNTDIMWDWYKSA